jgi:hypothetical protein
MPTVTGLEFDECEMEPKTWRRGLPQRLSATEPDHLDPSIERRDLSKALSVAGCAPS